MKFYLSTRNKTFELDFLGAAKILECSESEKRAKLPLEDYFELLDKNKRQFYEATIEEVVDKEIRRGADSSNKLLKIMKATQKNSKQLTEDQEEYIKNLIDNLNSGSIPKKIIQNALKSLQKIKAEIHNPLKVVEILQTEISSTFLKSHFVEITETPQAKREVILSLYLAGEEK